MYACIDVYGPFDGTIKAMIKEDLAFLLDRVVLEKQYSISIDENNRKTIKIAFTPHKASSNTLRGYFIVIGANGVISEQENSYPPRLKVIERTTTTTSQSSSPVSEGVLSILDISWIINGHESTQCRYGDTVTVIIRIKAQDGKVSGVMTIYLKKDKALLPDQVLESKSYNVNLYPGEETTLKLTFIVPDKPGGTVRGYFVGIYFNNKKVYTNAYNSQ